MLAALLRRLADWLDPPRPVVVPEPEPNPFHARVRSLIAIVEARFGAGFGEAKRRDVYARLMKEFPEARKRDLAFAIEQVLQELA
jgi:hypothetical protein